MDFVPEFFRLIRSYSWSFFRKDLIAGLTVGVVALPLAMAFGIASGVPPERGLFTAIVAGFFISFLGGSRGQIGGPTGAFVILVYSIVDKYGYDGLQIATLMASFFLLLLGFLRLGSWIKYVPYSLIAGFTSGIALLIFSSQVKDFLGLSIAKVPAEFIDKWSAYFSSFHTAHTPTLLLSLLTLAFILGVRRFLPKAPWGIMAIVFAVVVSSLFGLDTPTIQSRFGGIPSQLPTPSIPSWPSNWHELVLPSMAIALLGGIESLLACVIADRLMKTRHRSNVELMGQGVSNFFSVLFGGIPATGAIARTVVNAKTGAATPVAGMIHAAVLLLIILFGSSLVSQVPLAALSAVLMVMAYNMADFSTFRHLLRGPMQDRITLLAAFFLTVFVDVTAAILGGMALSSLLFMKKMGEMTEKRPSHSTETEEVHTLHGPLFFGASDLLHQIEPKKKICILQMSDVPLIDASGLLALEEFSERCKGLGVELYLTGLKGNTLSTLRQGSPLLAPLHTESMFTQN